MILVLKKRTNSAVNKSLYEQVMKYWYDTSTYHSQACAGGAGGGRKRQKGGVTFTTKKKHARQTPETERERDSERACAHGNRICGITMYPKGCKILFLWNFFSKKSSQEGGSDEVHGSLPRLRREDLKVS